MEAAPIPTERATQRTIVAWLRAVLPPDSIVAAVVNEQRADSDDPVKRARFGMARAKSGVVAGFPDLVILLPDGRTYVLEIKPEHGGMLSPKQERLHKRIRLLGHQVSVADSIEVARFVLRRDGVPLREREPITHAEADRLETRALKLATKVRRDARLNDAIPF